MEDSLVDRHLAAIAWRLERDDWHRGRGVPEDIMEIWERSHLGERPSREELRADATYLVEVYGDSTLKDTNQKFLIHELIRGWVDNWNDAQQKLAEQNLLDFAQKYGAPLAF